MRNTIQMISRREFLQTMALSAGAVGLAGQLFGERRTNADWRPRQCLSSVMFPSLSLAAFCAQAQALGFRGIDLWAPFGPCDHLEQARKMGARAFLELLQAHDLEVGAWTVYESKQYKKRFAGYAEFIGACGGGTVVFGTLFGDEAKQNPEQSFREYFDGLVPEIELAKQHSVQFAVENHSYSIFNSPESFEIFHRLNPDAGVVGIALAPYHLQIAKVDVVETIRACRGKLRFFYAWQRGKGTLQLPGEGPADFRPWLEALEREHYTQWMTPFMHGELPLAEMVEVVDRSKQYLESLKVR